MSPESRSRFGSFSFFFGACSFAGPDLLESSTLGGTERSALLEFLAVPGLGKQQS